MTTEHVHTAAFRGATFRFADLTGATFRECDLSQVRIVGSQVTDLQISGFDGEAGRVVVDDVDVTAFVAAQLDERYPERVRMRSMRTADDYRAMWRIVEQLWDETIERAARLPDDVRHERVDDEWSFAETLRHLVFAIDSWVGNMVLARQKPYHGIGLPPTDFAAADAATIGIEVDAMPSYEDVLAAYAERRGQVRAVVEPLTDDELEQHRDGTLSPQWGTESHTVAECLLVVMREHCEHRRFALRALTVLEAR